MSSHTDPMFDRAAGCLMGQIAGDSLGALVEFCSPATIRERYPDGPRLLEDGGTWDILAGQPTDDSEMALMLARLLAGAVGYDAEDARRRYLFWLESRPFDMGRTIALGLRGHPDPDSQANGALMRVSPLGIFGATRHWQDVARWAQQDAALTHAHPVCRQAGRPGVHHPRPDCFWPVDVLDLVPRLLEDRRDFRWERFCSTEDDLPTLIRKS